MSVGSVPKCCGCIRRQSFRQVWHKSTVDCMRNANKCPKITYSVMMKKTKKWSGMHTQIRITTKSQSLLEGHLLPVPATFGRLPFPRSSVILFTERQNNSQNDDITCACLLCQLYLHQGRGYAFGVVGLSFVLSPCRITATVMSWFHYGRTD